MNAMPGGVAEVETLVRNLVLSTPRIASAFLVLPLLSREDAPPLVRNSIYVALALAVTPLVGAAAKVPPGFVPWVGIVVKEALIGAVIGFAFAAVLWALAMAGDVIDTKVGTSMATVTDPMAGNPTTLTGAFLTRFANYVFLGLGGLTIFLELLLTSYQVWPIYAAAPDLRGPGLEYFTRSFGAMMVLAFMLAAPALILMSMIDLTLGIMNRYAPQLNVLPLTMALKAWSTSGILLLGLGAYLAVLLDTFDRSRGLLDTLKAVLR
jgi:type III secretion protein T